MMRRPCDARCDPLGIVVTSCFVPSCSEASTSDSESSDNNDHEDKNTHDQHEATSGNKDECDASDEKDK